MSAPYQKERSTASGCFAAAAVLCALAAFLMSVGILGWQVLTWLKTGVWPAMPTGDYLVPLLSHQARAWIAHPDSWLGVHRIVVGFLGLSLWFSVMVVGAGLYWVLMKGSDAHDF